METRQLKGSRLHTAQMLSPFSLFIQPRTPALVVVTPTFRVGLPTSVNPKHPHRHTQWCLAQSEIILGPVKLIIKAVKSHSPCLPLRNLFPT